MQGSDMSCEKPDGRGSSAGSGHPEHFDQSKQDPQQAEQPLTLPVSQGPGILIDTLARLPEKTILDEARLAHILQVSARTVRRMVMRFELPPSTKLAGRSVWMAGNVLAHIEAGMQRSERDAERYARRIRDLSP